MADFVIERLVAAGLADQVEVKMLLSDPRYAGLEPSQALMLEGLIDEEWLCQALSEEYELPRVDLSTHKVNADLVASIPREILKNYNVYPVAREGDVLTLAMADPNDVNAEDVVRYVTGGRIRRVLATRTAIQAAIAGRFQVDQDGIGRILDRVDEADELEYVETRLDDDSTPEQGGESAAPIIQLVNSIIANAIRLKASDIHFEPLDEGVRVRYRVDGILRVEMELPKKVQNACISRFKLLAGLDISETRRPQDGRAQVKMEGRYVDLRISSLRVYHGEKIVVRVLDSSTVFLTLEQLGMLPKDLRKFTQLLKASQGMLLITGPTGSGKTSTLYSALKLLNSEGVNIVTVEDPVEYQLAGVNQVQVQRKAGVTFASALRSILRQDPDICMLGEIRDLETAEIAFQAAQTGHLVLATLHTNDAPSAVTRLLLMGVPTYLLNSALLGVAAQRLVRQLCPHCKEEGAPTQEQLDYLSMAAEGKMPGRCWVGRGCPRCNQTGYRGRTGLFELFTVNDTVRELFMGKVSDAGLWYAARKAGMNTLLEDGLKKVDEGLTSLSEVLRVVTITHQREVAEQF